MLKHSFIFIGAVVLLTVVALLQLPRLKLENDARDCFMPHEDESYLRMVQSEDDFASTYVIGVSLQTTAHTILSAETFSVTKNIVNRLEQVDNIDIVDSIANIDYICIKDGGLVAEPLISEDLFTMDDAGKEHFIGTQRDIDAIDAKIVGWEDMYDRVITSDDGHATQIQIVLRHKKLLDDGSELRIGGNERMAALADIRKIVEDETKGTDLVVRYYGDTVVSDNSRTFMLSDLVRLIPIVVIVVILTLFFSFKTLDGTLLPLLTVLIATIWTCSLMAILGVPFTIVSSIIPVALIAVGSAYGIHVLTHYYIALDKKLAEGVVMTKELHQSVIEAGLKDVFVAVLLAGLTTVVGFISLITSPLTALRSFAVFTSLGVFFALVLSLTFIPCLLMQKPLKAVGQRSRAMEKLVERAKKKAEAKLDKIHINPGEHRASGGTLFVIYKFFSGTTPRLILFTLVLVAVGVCGVKKLKIETATINYFPEDSKVRQDVNYVNGTFAGSNTISLIVTKLDDAESALDNDKDKKRKAKANGDKTSNKTLATEGASNKASSNADSGASGASDVSGVSNTNGASGASGANTSDATNGAGEDFEFDFAELEGEGANNGAGKVADNKTGADNGAGDFEFDFSELEGEGADKVADNKTGTASGAGGEDFNFDFDFENSESGTAQTVTNTEEVDHGCADVEMLIALSDMQEYLCEQFPEIGKVVSFTTFVKRMNSVMNDPYTVEEKTDDPLIDVVTLDGQEYISATQYQKALERKISAKDLIEVLNAAYIAAGGKRAKVKDIIGIAEKKLNYTGLGFYEIPYNVTKYPVASRAELSNLVSQYLMLLGGDTLKRFSSPNGSFSPKKIRSQLQIRSHSTILTSKILKVGEEYAKRHFPKGYKVEFTGGGQIDCAMTDMIIPSQIKSLGFSLLSVFIIIALSFKSPLAGIIGVIPLALTILLNYMVMGFAGIRLDLVTSIIASVAIGVGIDYTIHFLETFKNERHENDKMSTVLKNTFNKSGVGIVTNALAVGLGFLVLCGSKFVVLQFIGILVAIVMFTSATLSLTFIPGVLNLKDPKCMQKKEEKKEEGESTAQK